VPTSHVIIRDLWIFQTWKHKVSTALKVGGFFKY